jgi:type 1 glutamine amidotransferase
MRVEWKIWLALALLGFASGVRAQPADVYDQSRVPLEVDTPDPTLTKIVLVAGRQSHGPGEHEHFAGCVLLMNMLKQTPGVFPVLARDGWPKNPAIFDGAKALVFYADGGGGHPILQGDHLQVIDALMKKGVGLACLHYACEPTKDKGQREFLDWIGGAFEINWSVNPHWLADFKELPRHPITRGVVPFAMQDEWYFHMRFVDGMKGVTPILSAVAPSGTMARGDGPHSGNPAVRQEVAAGVPQHVAWARERPDGARGFGFTGGHFHKNWGDANFRRIAVNAILWTAKCVVPPGGAPVALDPAHLNTCLDDKGHK